MWDKTYIVVSQRARVPAAALLRIARALYEGRRGILQRMRKAWQIRQAKSDRL